MCPRLGWASWGWQTETHAWRDVAGSCAAMPPALKGVQKPSYGGGVCRTEGLQLAGGERLDKAFMVLGIYL